MLSVFGKEDDGIDLSLLQKHKKTDLEKLLEHTAPPLA